MISVKEEMAFGLGLKEGLNFNWEGWILGNLWLQEYPGATESQE